jgi:hypothetical protein
MKQSTAFHTYKASRKNPDQSQRKPPFCFANCNKPFLQVVEKKLEIEEK